MLSKSECRDYINSKKAYLNLSSICRVLNIKQPHISRFLKSHYYDDSLSIEKANEIVDFIEKI